MHQLFEIIIGLITIFAGVAGLIIFFKIWDLMNAITQTCRSLIAFLEKEQSVSEEKINK